MSDGEDETLWVCAGCVGEEYLSGEIAANGQGRTCGFCDAASACISVGQLADYIEAAFETHYYRTSDQPDFYQSMLLNDRESNYDFERPGDEVLYAIGEAAAIDEVIAQAVLDVLSDRHGDFESAAMGEETEFDPDSYYAPRGPNDIELQLAWKSLERSLKGEARFFNKEAEDLLGRLFRGVGSYSTVNGRAVVKTAGVDADLPSFFRARVFHTGAALARALERPDRELGPPPSAIAIGGRMNAAGVALFYGATDAEAALAEVRPTVGSRVLVARFDVIRPLRLLDVDALRSVYVNGSIFDPSYMGRLELAKFLESLSERMTLPVMPGDEPAEYLITQVIADYLAGDAELGLDGLLYPSVQRAGKHQNVVLFRAASRVAELDLPAGTKVSAQLEDFDEEGASPSYWVSESVPPPVPVAPEADDDLVAQFRPGPYLDPFSEPEDGRQTSLALAVDTLQVHHVEALVIDTTSFDVTRLRHTSGPRKF
ncbi:RES family NAD+ phosphorylase [Caulobacter hibisci]|uniref:RES family NAD+ phosphorylase n=1 Tax=Caulobacter hibisci TaxID=2035993 RepID=A0ABS0T5B0_9CAUL|nr:RES family NAD+ phosphorylase [Caulobacter hibisci]MBI1687053.1 RES family NAD+ phosphorylase [Caulobacter hibisci]